MNEVEVRGAVKRYPEGAGWLEVLHGVSLTVAAGEFVAVVGPSGAGKSTLLHLIGGLDLPAAGEVAVEGQVWSRLAPRQRARLRNEAVGFVFQSYHLLPELTVLENVMLPGLIGWRQDPVAVVRRRAQELVDIVGLGPRQAHRPSELSGGEQQRAAIARALVNQPRLLLCDEPTGNLDTASGQQVLALLQRWHRERRTTVLIVTHEAALAGAADRVVAMRDGQILNSSVVGGRLA